MKKLIYSFLFLFLSIHSYAIAAEKIIRTDSTSRDLNNIYLKCRQLLLSDVAYANEQSYRQVGEITYSTNAKGYLKIFNPNGFFSDIDYQSKERNEWQPCWHLFRLMLFGREWQKTKEIKYLQALHKGLGYWIKNDFQCENWWHNQINVPYLFSSLVIMLNNEATPAELTYLDKILRNRVQQKSPTGQNKIWQHDIEARMALISKDTVAFRRAINGMKSLIVTGTQEGIQPDYSFHQHGAMLQLGGYGFHYVNSLLFWITVTARSTFDFEASKEKILFDYCSEGLRWTVFNKSMDLTAIGRQLRFDCDLKRGVDLNNNFKLIKASFPVDACSFSVDGFGKSLSQQCPLTGNKNFWRSDYMIQRKDGAYMMSVKTHGDYVKKIESINSENLKGAFLNDGVCLIQHSGMEYRNIEPFWNWTMLPGTTCDTTADPANPNVLKSNNQSDFVGQVSNGKSGLSVMTYNRDGIKANKSWFFADNLMVALGSGIEAPSRSNLVTTIDQWFNSTRIVQSAPSQSIHWLWHDNIGFIIPGDQEFNYKKSLRKGDWSKIDKVSTDQVKKDFVFSVYLGHNQHNTYAYIVNPDCKLAEMEKMTGSGGVKILSNTTDVQAIHYSEGIMAVFYKPAALNISSGETIRVNQPCVLIYNQKGIWVSDPTRKLKSVQIQIGGKTTNVTLPTGDYLGSTVKVSLPGNSA
jgi:chondroitin AC lyase